MTWHRRQRGQAIFSGQVVNGAAAGNLTKLGAGSLFLANLSARPHLHRAGDAHRRHKGAGELAPATLCR